MVRAILAIPPLILSVATFIAELNSNDGFVAEDLFWPLLWFFVAWRFFRLGLYTSPWGVRISNPVLTYWYPWRKIDRFDIVLGEEAFLKKPKIVALVTKRNRRRPIFSLSTGVAFFSLDEAKQAEVIDRLNRLQSRSGAASA